MIQRYRSLQKQYPRQFWLLFWGMLISASGNSMIWPFITIFLIQKLDISLTTATLLMTVKSMTILFASLLVGPLVDRFGRKQAMVISVGATSLVYVLMAFGTSLPYFIVLMAFSGLVQPLYRIGADAMIADMLPPEQRVDGYSLMRMINNVGVAIGPMVGGFLAATSYTITFFIGAACLAIFTFIIAFWIRETLDKTALQSTNLGQDFREYTRVFKDSLFMKVCTGFTLAMMGSVQLFVLLGVYGKTNFAMPESQFGLVIAVNALMVVFLQYPVTQFTRKQPPLSVMTAGALLYGLGLGSIALGSNAWHFALSMVILTTGELILVPTTTTLVANLAPANMRGRYMSIYSLTMGIGQGIGPVMGGFLNDNVAPIAIWYGTMVLGLLSMLVFFSLKGKYSQKVSAFST
ncbi:MAG: MFS transporter [Anaerolineaceae bacterium]|nr:MFS transporter [Anaerolineaceae bacterium]